nr:MAG TPA: Toll-like receptor 3 trans-membrane domain [Caudoviricetes sp.]
MLDSRLTRMMITVLITIRFQKWRTTCLRLQCLLAEG